MDPRNKTETPTFRPFTILAGGCLLILCSVLLGVSSVLGYQQLVLKNLPTTIPTVTPRSHLLVEEPVDKNDLIYEGFSSNKNDWGLYHSSGKLETINGNLILQSNSENGSAIGVSNQFNASTPKYYLQADLSTDIDTALPFGLVFGLDKSSDTYYLIQIRPKAEDIQLFKFNAGEWRELVPYTSIHLNPYPQANTLGVSFDRGSMKLYVNGEQVTEYSDRDSFQSRDVGVFVSQAGYRLIVDNFFIYNKE
jgi:hypothetical protein